MTPAEVIAHANSDMPLPNEALEAAALILHMLEHGYADDQVDAAHEHWSGYPKDIRRWGHEDAARVLRAAIGGAGLVVVSAEDLRAVRRCPNGCGRVSDHPHGGPCATCWDELGLPERTENA